MPLVQPWHLLDSAIDRYMFARKWPSNQRTDATHALTRLMQNAKHKETDPDGRELWRSPLARQQGAGLRWVVHPPKRDGDWPFVPWVGFQRPPAALFVDSRELDEPATKQCPHLPTLGAVYEVRVHRVSTPRTEAVARSHPWTARVCARCAEAVRAAVGRPPQG